MLFNARSLKNKLSEFNIMLKHEKPDIVMVTETWLDDSVTDSLLCNGADYSIFRNDRGSVGGGVVIFTKNQSVMSCQCLSHLNMTYSRLLLLT